MHLFTYGTLMQPEVWLRAAGRPHSSEPAVLRGYEARCLQDVDFPGLIESPEAITRGRLYRDVDAEVMARLDEYEDDFYRRITVAVETPDRSPVEAQVYLIAAEHRSIVLRERWVPPVDPNC